MNTLTGLSPEYIERLKERFWAKVDIRGEDHCWEWQAGKERFGYGLIGVAGFTMRSHRLSFILAKGEIRQEDCVCHSCDNPPCVNPNHLWIGSRANNFWDMVTKNRNFALSSVGESNFKSKLTEADAAKIIELAKAGVTVSDLMKQYDLSRSGIHNLLRGKVWKHLELNANLPHVPRRNISEKIVFEVIRLSREENLSAKEISETLGITSTHVNNILCGKRRSETAKKVDFVPRIARSDYKGTNNPKVKLTEEKVFEILKTKEEKGLSNPEIAKMFNVSVPTIWQICSGRSWTHIPRKS